MKSTAEIENEMKKVTSFEELEEIMKRENIGQMRFCDRLAELCNKYEKKSSQILNKAAISKSQLAAMLNGTRNPSKESVIKLALAIGMSVDELNELLKLAGYKELYVKNKDDAIILFGIKNQLDIDEIASLLEKKKSKIRLYDKDEKNKA